MRKLVVQTNDAGHYALVVSNPAGTTNVNVDLNVLVPHWITQQPLSIVTNQASTVTFSVSVFGTASLFYQWYKNGTNAIANATNSALTLLNVQTADAAASYSCLLTNIAGTSFSARGWLSIIPTGGGATTNGWGSGGTNSRDSGCDDRSGKHERSNSGNSHVWLSDFDPFVSVKHQQLHLHYQRRISFCWDKSQSRIGLSIRG